MNSSNTECNIYNDGTFILIPKKPLVYLNELNKFFYENQYNEEQYPTFRCCDIDYDYDGDGNKYRIYTYYDDELIYNYSYMINRKKYIDGEGFEYNMDIDYD